jgi:hypothetical protein
MLEDLVVGAVNQAVAKAKQMHAESLKSMTGGIQLPGLDDAMTKFFGGPPAETTTDNETPPESTPQEV